MYRILICDDDKDIVNALKIYLSDPDYELREAYSGQEALEKLAAEDFQLILLDIMMPGMDGISAMVRLRETSNVPVILLTAKSEDSDKILGLTLGADDYITKPFNPAEVTARVKSQLRRYTRLGGSLQKTENVVLGGIELDDGAKKVLVDGEEVSLTPKEYEILKLLLCDPGKVYSPAEIYRHVWKEEPLGADGTVEVHIRHLREKIEFDPADPRYLKVVWGQGYKIDKPRR